MNTEASVPALDIQNVSKTFTLESGEEVRAARNQSLRVEQGEFICVIGPSGHGKSTLLNMIAGFIKPTSGTISVSGRPVTGPGPDRGVVFQRDTLFLWKRVAENIEFGMKAQGVPKAERERTVTELLEVTGLQDFAKAWPKQLSGGMRRRVAIAAVLANKPDVMLMDEPFSGLDYLRLMQMHSFLLNLWQESGHRAVVMVTHDVDEAISLADRIVLVKNGSIALDKRVELARPRSSADITSESANRLRAELLRAFEGEE